MSVKLFEPSIAAWAEKLLAEYPKVWEAVRGLSAPDALKACYPDQWDHIKALPPYEGIVLVWGVEPAL